MQHFAVQSVPGQQTTHSLRASQYRRSKRKRDEDTPNDEHEGEAPSPAPSNAQSYPSSDPLETAQLRVAGLLSDDAAEIPPRPFPHAPARTSSHPFTYTALQRSLADLNPPLFAVNATSKRGPVDRSSEGPGLRETHLGILTTLMHRCLLEGDFLRAGKAWGLILRTQISGTAIDPRNHGRWGIGAELLLHRQTRDMDQNKQSFADEISPYTDEGFELAREYYERLIVQHPNRKHVPRAIDELTFYPAMFSLWIYEVCERCTRARRRFEAEHGASTPDNHLAEESMTLDDARADASVLAATELLHAKEISGRLDQLIVSPPFDKHADLLQLRGMVGLWLADLVLRGAKRHSTDDWDQILSGDDDDNTGESAPAKLHRFSESLRELTRALESFERAQANGRQLGDVLYDVSSRMNDLSKGITSLAGE